MFGVMVANHYSSFLNYRGRIGRASYGDMLMALAISLSAFITNNKVFFMIAILLLAISDGLAAVIGSAYGKRWSYKVLGYKKKYCWLHDLLGIRRLYPCDWPAGG